MFFPWLTYTFLRSRTYVFTFAHVLRTCSLLGSCSSPVQGFSPVINLVKSLVFSLVFNLVKVIGSFMDLLFSFVFTFACVRFYVHAFILFCVRAVFGDSLEGAGLYFNPPPCSVFSFCRVWFAGSTAFLQFAQGLVLWRCPTFIPLF